MRRKPIRERESRDRVAEFVLIRKVARQLAALSRAAVVSKLVENVATDWRGIWVDESWEPTVFDYYTMDPMFRSTMVGAFAGRVLGK